MRKLALVDLVRAEAKRCWNLYKFSRSFSLKNPEVESFESLLKEEHSKAQKKLKGDPSLNKISGIFTLLFCETERLKTSPLLSATALKELANLQAKHSLRSFLFSLKLFLRPSLYPRYIEMHFDLIKREKELIERWNSIIESEEKLLGGALKNILRMWDEIKNSYSYLNSAAFLNGVFELAHAVRSQKENILFALNSCYSGISERKNFVENVLKDAVISRF